MSVLNYSVKSPAYGFNLAGFFREATALEDSNLKCLKGIKNQPL